MKNKTFIYARTFAWALLAIFLVSSVIGTTVWAKRPQPPPTPETDTFQIYIGTGGQDVVLTSPEIGYLTAEAYSDGFLPPPTEPGKKTQSLGWNVYLNELITGSTDECAEYTVNIPEFLNYAFDHNYAWSTVDAQYFTIVHSWVSRPRSMDFWYFQISWGVDPANMNPGDAWALSVTTNQDFAPEGTYDSQNANWTINFNGASWELVDFDGIGNGYVVLSGIISSLTVTVVRT